MAKTLAMLHTVAVLAEPLAALARECLPGAAVFHVVDEGLLAQILREGRITAAMCERVVHLAMQAEADGAQAILLTCSAMSPAVDVARPRLRVPIYKMDEAMAERALDVGRRVGVFATADATLQSVGDLVRQVAARRGVSAEVVTDLCRAAMDAARAGRREEHDALVRAALHGLAPRCDVLVVAQASAAQALTPAFVAALPCPVLTSPRLALERLAAAWPGA